ncbi:MAG: PorT family protein [Prolixibacteraceae bacterium]|nr:PorT family protein [Prolixibacteraceae bacterium]
MKVMMKLMYFLMFSTLTLPAISQVIGIKGGLNLANILAKSHDGTNIDEFKMKPSFHIGLTAEFPATETTSFETGLFLSTKGFKLDVKESSYSQKSNANLLYLDVPLLAKVYFNAGGSRIYAAFGPYLGFGLSGKTKNEVTYNGQTELEEIDLKWGSGEDDDIKPLDYGLIAGAGINIKSMEFGLNYSYGLANLEATSEDDSEMKNRVISISVGYKFNSK